VDKGETVSFNPDEQLVNADWPKETCDWPLDVTGRCDERAIVAAGFDESKHPRHPSGSSEGGRFATLDVGDREAGIYKLEDLAAGEVFKYQGQDPGGPGSIQWFRIKHPTGDEGTTVENVETGEEMKLPPGVDLQVEVPGIVYGVDAPLEPVVASDVEDRGGSTSNKVYWATIDGVEYVAKPINEEGARLRDFVEPGRDIQRELAAQVMAEEIKNASPGLSPDLRVAPVVEANIAGLGHVALSTKVEGDEADGIDFITDEEARAITLYDYVIGNTDRHLGNVIEAPEGEIWLIDQGLAFPSQNEDQFGRFHVLDNKQRFGETEFDFPDAKQSDAIGGMLEDWERIDTRLRPYLTEAERRAMWRRLEYMNNGAGKFPTTDEWKAGVIDEMVQGYGWHPSVTLGQEED